MANVTRIDQSTLNNASATINKSTETLVSEIDSMLGQLRQSKEIYQTNSDVAAQVDSIISELESVKSGYLGHNQDFMKVLSDTVSNYAATDAQILAQAMGQGDRPSYVPENAVKNADGRWEVLDENGKGTIYNNNGIQGTPIETDDVRIKALASGMEGGQVVQMNDGRIAVKDKYGGGTIFNADGSTEAVSGRTIVAGKVGTVQASGNGADPYTQDLATELANSGLSDKKVNKLINNYEAQQEAGKTDSTLSVDTEALRDHMEMQKENGTDEITNYGPGFTPEQNAQALASNMVKDGLGKVAGTDGGQVGEQVSTVTPSVTDSQPIGGESEITLGTQVSKEAITGNPINLKDYGPGFSKEHNDAVLAARAEQQVGSGMDTSTAGTTVNNIPEPSQPIGFDGPMTEVMSTEPVSINKYSESTPNVDDLVPDYAQYVPFDK